MRPSIPPQNVADHAWHVAVILGLIDPFGTVDDLKTALSYDVAEIKHGDLTDALKRAVLELARLCEEQESETLRRSTSQEATYSPAMKIAHKLADLWMFAIQCRLGNREASSGFTKHRQWIDAMNLEAYPATIMIRDAIEQWCMFRSTILREELTWFTPRRLTWRMVRNCKSRSTMLAARLRITSTSIPEHSVNASRTFTPWI